MAVNDQFAGYAQQGLLAEPMDVSPLGDFGRGLQYSPFDLLGAPVDLVNMGLQGIDALYGARNVLGSEQPFLGSEYLIDKYADLGEATGLFDYQRPTGSLAETAGRITGGVLAPTGGAAALGRGVDLLETGMSAYAAGAPARVAERARTTTLGSGIDPTAALDDMIVRGMGDNGGPPMTPEVPAGPDIDDLGFVSQALETAKGLEQAKGTGQQYRSQLLKAGVKEDEIAFTPGLEGLLSQPRVTRDELVGLLETNRIRPYETIYAADDGSSFERMNFPATAEVLDVETAYGPDYIDEEINMMLEDDLDVVLNVLETNNPGRYATLEGGAELASIRRAIEGNNFESIDGDVQQDILDLTRGMVEERYSYDPILRLQDPDTGYEIVGSDDMGYTIRDDGGKVVDPGNDVPYSLSEARIQAETDAIDRGLIGYEGGGTRFEDHKEVGGSNYQEIMLQVPNFEGKTQEFVYSGHFDEPDIAVHARTTDRTTDEGQDVLYVEEMQSDWGQQGRKYGFDSPKDKEKLSQIEKAAEGVQKKLDDVVDERDAFYLDFINSVAEKVGGLKISKDDLDYSRFGVNIQAADGSELLSRSEMNSILRGVDQVALTSDGRELPIDPSNFDGVDIVTKMGDFDFRIRSARDDLDKVRGQFRADTPVGPFVGKSDKFAEVGIKRLLIKAVEEGKDYIQFSNGNVQDVRWNEEGLKTFYDRIIPKAASKVVKKLDPDASVGIEGLGTVENRAYRDDPGTRFTIEITPKMREAIKKGIPLFSAGGAGLLGVGMQDEPQPAGGIL